MFQSVTRYFNLFGIGWTYRYRCISEPDPCSHAVQFFMMYRIFKFNSPPTGQIEQAEQILSPLYPLIGIKVLPSSVMYTMRKGCTHEVGIGIIQWITFHYPVEYPREGIVGKSKQWGKPE